MASGIALIAVLAVVLLLVVVAAINIARAPARPAVRERPHGNPWALGLPAGRIVYADADGTARPLVARRYPLTGKPDYVVLTPGPNGGPVPVELKSGRAPRAGGNSVPRHEDVLQLVTYLIILDDLYDQAPRHGLLRYADATFEVPYSDDLRAEVLDLLAEMQALDGEGSDDAPPGDPSLAKCRACAFKEICEDALKDHPLEQNAILGHSCLPGHACLPSRGINSYTGQAMSLRQYNNRGPYGSSTH